MNKRPYIIINGVNSLSVIGLLISELAPISKPQQRTRVEVIDGRDGEITTPLGFASYDKVIKIGLTYNYNIDDIIAFFNSSGKVVFSNEPDKYYKFAIYEQIDFERLIRFKTAEVTFRVEPFKFSEADAEKTYNVIGGQFYESIRNNGNYYSRPTIKITGRGALNFLINDKQILNLNLGSNYQTVIIDAEKMNAYSLTGQLLNRLVLGNYDNIVLDIGNNFIEIIGDVTSVSISNYSRWL